MATVLDSLVVLFGLDPSGIKKGTEEGKSSLEGLKSTALKVFAVIGGAALLKSAFSNYLTAADSVDKLSAKLGENASEMQAWGGAVALEGGSIESFNASISNLNEGLVQMATTGGGRSAKFFEALGISAVDASGKVKPATSVLLELSDKFKDLSAQEAAGLGAKLGLDAGTISMLRKGRDGVAAMVKEQKELGEYTDRDRAAATEFNDALEKNGKAMSMVAAKIFTLFTPALTGIMDAIRPVITQIRVWIEMLTDKLEPAITGVSKFMKEHQTVIRNAFAFIAGAITALLLPALWSAVVAMYLLLAPFLLLAAAIILGGLLIGLLVEDFEVWRAGGDSAIGWLLGKFQEFWAWIKSLASDLGGVFSGAWDHIKRSASNALDWLKDSFKNTFSGIFGLIDNVGTKFGGIWNGVKGLASEFFTWIEEKLGGLVKWGGKVASALGLGGGDDEGKEGATGGLGAKDAVSPLAAGASGNKSVTASQSVGVVNIHTGTTDVAGVASSFSQKTGEDFSRFVMNVDSGVVQ